MSILLTAAQMRAIEQAAIASGEVTGLELMERAGRGVVEAVFAEWPELAKTSHKVVVLCGPGNNGGDGFVVARLLKKWGWEVEVFLYGDPDRLPPDAKMNYQRWRKMGEVGPIEAQDWGSDLATRDDVGVVIDALFGTGLTRPFSQFPHIGMSLQACAHNSGPGSACPRVVSVDVPSGLCADSGRFLGVGIPFDERIHANLVVTFEREKPGHVLADGPLACGQVRVVPLGIGGRLPELARAGRPDVAARTRQPALDWLRKTIGNGEHKYSHGHALILSGPSGKGGAARLAARGALRIGAGVVTLGVPHEALVENAAQLTAIMLAEVDDGATLARMLGDKRLNALALGPGIGRARARELVPEALAACRATVLDADALTAYAGDPSELFDILHENTVLTPHAGEFARLFPDIAQKLAAPATKGPAYSKVDATREAAARAGCVVLYKGPDTVIAHPDGRASINSAACERAAPWLATAGAGDVLSGFIAGLMARGFAPMAAAETAAWLHVECALSFGPGLIAEDLPEALPKVFRDLRL